MNIISISRRTDIPAFYTPWLLKRTEAGFCHCFNPFNHKEYLVSLAPSECLAWVFWTRDPQPLLPHLDSLRNRGYHFYMHFTLNGYPSIFETNNKPIDQSIELFHQTSKKIGPAFLFWRYDPIIISSLTAPAYHLDKFERLCKALEGTTKRCYTSFVDYYAKTKKNLNRLTTLHGIRYENPSTTLRENLLFALSEIAQSHGISLFTCCEENLAVQSVHRAHCVDRDVVRRLRPDLDVQVPNAPSRKYCGCVKSIDIGVYQTCTHGCVYCYANHKPSVAEKRFGSHDVNDTVLWRRRNNAN